MKLSFLCFFTLVLGLQLNAQNYDWSRGFGSNTTDSSTCLTTDNSGNVYTIGVFSGEGDFRPDSVVVNLKSAGKEDVFIQKLDSLGKFVWVKQIGGVGTDKIFNATIYNNALYVVGSFESSVDFENNSKQSAGGSDGFIAKFDLDGKLTWLKTLGSSRDDRFTALTVSKDGLFVGGEFSGNIEGTYADTAMVLQKRDFEGNLNWTKIIGKQKSVKCNSLSLDSLGNVYVGGSLLGTDVVFNPGANPSVKLSSKGLTDIFVQKLNGINGELIWVKQIGGISSDEVSTLVVKKEGIYFTGYYYATVDFDASEQGKLELTSVGKNDLFVAKYNLGGEVVWVKSIGSSKTELGKALDVDKFENVYVTGSFNTGGSGVDFDPGSGTKFLKSTTSDIFILKLKKSGDYSYAQSFACDGSDLGTSIKVDEKQNFMLTGIFGNKITFSKDSSFTSVGLNDVFVLRSLLHPKKSILVEEISLLSSLAPNPFSNNLFIQFPVLTSVSELSIVDIKGSVVLKDYLLAGESEKILHLEKLPNGLYTLYLQSEGKFTQRKIVKN